MLVHKRMYCIRSMIRKEHYSNDISENRILRMMQPGYITGNLTHLAISCEMRSAVAHACLLPSCLRNLSRLQQSETQYAYPPPLWYQINRL